jgi:hypothetical protein
MTDVAFTDTPLFFFILGAVSGVLVILAFLGWAGWHDDEDDDDDQDGSHPIPGTP